MTPAGPAPTTTYFMDASGLEEVAQLLIPDPRGAARKVAIERAAALIRKSPEPVRQRVERDGLEGVHSLGIGWELAGVITDWVRSGRLTWREQLLEERRRELLRVGGLNQPLADALRDVLGVVDLEGLARAVREGQLLRVCGFGPKRVRQLEERFCGARAG